MILSGYGHSTDSETLEAFRSAVSQAVGPLNGVEPEVVILFVSGEHLGSLEDGLATAAEVAGTDNVVGCSGMGILSIAAELEQRTGVVALAHDVERDAVVSRLATDPRWWKKL